MAKLEVRLLGKFALTYKNKPINISSRPAQSLFAYLLLNAGTAYRREKLAGMLWPDFSEETARDNLRHALWRIRKALEVASATRFLQANDLTIGFKATAEYWLDAAELKKLRKNASIDELVAVLSEYGGELLPGFYDEWVLLEREHLYSIFEHHIATLISLLQAKKRWLDVLDWGEYWIKLGQKPEPAYRALMTAYAAKGEMSEVAVTYKRCVKALQELGIEPSEQTRDLYEGLRVKKIGVKRRPMGAPKQGLEELPKTNLPVPLASFIGREREIEEAKRLLSTTRLLTLTGTGGIGKTRLAIQVAKDLISSYKDGVCWVELAPLMDKALIPHAVAQVLGVRESPNQLLTKSVKDFLREKYLLLILDNCEHLIDACAQLVGDLLSQCQNLEILATSREALGITGETILQIPGLLFPVLGNLSQFQNLKDFESIQLFAERAAAVCPNLALTPQNAFGVTQICHRLDGIPLAIELAAARVKMMSVEDIARRLNDRFNLLTAGSRTILPRHQTLRAAIDWSYDLLSEPERVLWRRLSVFSGGWTLNAVEAVCSDEILQRPQVWELLSHLVDKSLVVVEEQDGATRYRMLETIRRYGEEKLQISGENREIHTRHLEFFIQLAEQAEPKLETSEQKKGLAQMDSEYGNLRSAIDWTMEMDPVTALRLTVALGRFYNIRGYFSEGRKTIEQALKRATQAPKEIRAKGLLWIGALSVGQGDYARAKEPLQESVNFWHELRDQQGLAMSLNTLGQIAWLEGDHKRAQIIFEECLGLYRQSQNKQRIAVILCNLGNVARAQSIHSVARHYMEESVAILREFDDKFGVASVLNDLGVVAEEQGDYASARRCFQETIAISNELGAKDKKAYALNSLAHVLYLQDELVQAKHCYRESLIIFRETMDKRGIAYCLEGFSKIALRLGHAAQTAHLLGAAEALRQVIGAPLSGVEADELEKDMITTRQQLNDQAFALTWEEGQAMTLEQAVKFALEESGE